MPISSLVLTCETPVVDAVRSQLEAMQHIEVGRTVSGNRLPVVVDTHTRSQDRQAMRSIETMNGVIHTQVIFADFTDLNQEST